MIWLFVILRFLLYIFCLYIYTGFSISCPLSLQLRQSSFKDHFEPGLRLGAGSAYLGAALRLGKDQQTPNTLIERQTGYDNGELHRIPEEASLLFCVGAAQEGGFLCLGGLTGKRSPSRLGFRPPARPHSTHWPPPTHTHPPLPLSQPRDSWRLRSL